MTVFTLERALWVFGLKELPSTVEDLDAVANPAIDALRKVHQVRYRLQRVRKMLIGAIIERDREDALRQKDFEMDHMIGQEDE